MNLVLITSCLCPYSGTSFYSSDVRFKQLIELTITSVREKIPNSYVVVLEGSELSKKELETLEKVSDDLYFYNVKEFDKSFGELSLIFNYLNSDNFNSLIYNVDNIIKISGRYYLTKDFDFYKYPGCFIKKQKADWTNEMISETRLYKVSKNKIYHYINKLDLLIKNGIYRDIEHSFFRYNVVPCDHIIDKLGLAGFLGPTGEYVED